MEQSDFCYQTRGAVLGPEFYLAPLPQASVFHERIKNYSTMLSEERHVLAGKHRPLAPTCCISADCLPARGHAGWSESEARAHAPCFLTDWCPFSEGWPHYTTQTSLPPTQCSAKGSKRSKVEVAPSDMVMNFRCPYGCGDLTLPIFPYKAVWMCPLFPQINGGMYLRKKETGGHFYPYSFNNALKNPCAKVFQPIEVFS